MCTIQDSIAVEFIDCTGFIRNIITPNEDSHNEYFVFENIENRIWSLMVFNRWAGQVYFSEHYKNAWKGDELSEGIYYYKLFSKTLGKEVNGWIHVFLTGPTTVRPSTQYSWVNRITAFPVMGVANIFPNPVQEELTVEMTVTDATLNPWTPQN